MLLVVIFLTVVDVVGLVVGDTTSGGFGVGVVIVWAFVTDVVGVGKGCSIVVGDSFGDEFVAAATVTVLLGVTLATVVVSLVTGELGSVGPLTITLFVVGFDSVAVCDVDSELIMLEGGVGVFGIESVLACGPAVVADCVWNDSVSLVCVVGMVSAGELVVRVGDVTTSVLVAGSVAADVGNVCVGVLVLGIVPVEILVSVLARSVTDASVVPRSVDAGMVAVSVIVAGEVVIELVVGFAVGSVSRDSVTVDSTVSVGADPLGSDVELMLVLNSGPVLSLSVVAVIGTVATVREGSVDVVAGVTVA